MTLSARVALDPSRRLERLATLLPGCGLLVAASTLGLRWPVAAPVLLAVVVVGVLAIVAAARRRRRPALTLTLSRHREVDVQPDPAGLDTGWCLADSTVAWPGFAMLALRPVDPSFSVRTVRLAVFAHELAAADRRALGRFLVWSMHGGSSHAHRVVQS